MIKQLGVLALASLLVPVGAAQAQQPPAPLNPTTVCGSPIPSPAALPPAGSGPVVFLIAPCFEAQGNVALVDLQTYLYYIQLKAEPALAGRLGAVQRRRREGDSRRLQAAVGDRTSSTTSRSKPRTTRSRTAWSGNWSSTTWRSGSASRTSTTSGSKKLERTKIEEKLKKTNTVIRLDTFIDPSLIRKVEGLVRDMMKEKGFQSAEVTHEITRRLRGAQAGQRRLQAVGRARRSRFGTSISSATRRSAMGRCAGG